MLPVRKKNKKMQPFWCFAQEDLETSGCIYWWLFLSVLHRHLMAQAWSKLSEANLWEGQREVVFWELCFKRWLLSVAWKSDPCRHWELVVDILSGLLRIGGSSVLRLLWSSRCQRPADSCPIKRKISAAKSRFRSQISNLLRISIKIFAPCASSMICLFCHVTLPSRRKTALQKQQSSF